MKKGAAFQSRKSPQSESRDRLEKDLIGIEFDVNVLRDFLADGQAALLLGSQRLMLNLFSWLRTFCASRGMLPSEVERLIMALAAELKRTVPGKLAERVSVLAIESFGQLLKSDRRTRRVHGVPEAYLHLLLNRHGVEARSLILEQVANGKSTRYLHSQVLEPTMVEIGRLWLENKITVADEHFSTAVTEALMNSLHPLRSQRLQPKGRVLLFGVQTELHGLGLRTVGDFLELDGWDTIYFGPNLPLESLCSSIEKVRPDLIAVSVTIPSNLMATAEAIHRLRAMPVMRSIPVLVGGYPFSLDHSLYSKLGADAWAANATHAVRVARSLLKHPRQSPARHSVEDRTPADISFLPQYRAYQPSRDEELIRLMGELSAIHVQLRKRNALVEELSEEKNRFLGMAAHDLRNSIHAVMLINRLLGVSKESLSESQKRLVDRMDSLLKSTFELIEGYLDVSRIEAGRLELHPEPVDLISLIDERISVASLFAEAAGLRVFRTGIPRPAVVKIDANRVSQALTNLLLNAIKYSPHGGDVEVAVGTKGDKYVIDVMDQGPGIPSQQAARLFGPFITLGKAGETARPSTGLGLHIARRVIEAHGGSVSFHHRNPRGSVFRITLLGGSGKG